MIKKNGDIEQFKKSWNDNMMLDWGFSAKVFTALLIFDLSAIYNCHFMKQRYFECFNVPPILDRLYYNIETHRAGIELFLVLFGIALGIGSIISAIKSVNEPRDKTVFLEIPVSMEGAVRTFVKEASAKQRQ